MKNYKQGWHFLLHYKILITLIMAIAFLVFYECAPALYMPATADAQRTGIALDTLIEGRNLYLKNCASCHNLYPPERFTAKEWNKNVTRMQSKAKINNGQKEMVLKYLTAKSKN
jgi:hypothetical protein